MSCYFQRQVLYLTSDNNLRDCLDIAEDDDSSLNHDDLIQDYKKLGKRKKVNKHIIFSPHRPIGKGCFIRIFYAGKRCLCVNLGLAL